MKFFKVDSLLLKNADLDNWWAHQDSNLGPKDSILCDFRHSLDFVFTISKRLRWVPSSLYTFLKVKAWLGVAMLK